MVKVICPACAESSDWPEHEEVSAGDIAWTCPACRTRFEVRVEFWESAGGEEEPVDC